MKNTVAIRRVEVITDEKEYDFTETPIFYERYNYRQVVGIFPHPYHHNLGDKTVSGVTYDVYIAAEKRIEKFDLSMNEIVNILNKTAGKDGEKYFEFAEVILGLAHNIFNISEETFMKYYTDRVDNLKIKS